MRAMKNEQSPHQSISTFATIYLQDYQYLYMMERM